MSLAISILWSVSRGGFVLVVIMLTIRLPAFSTRFISEELSRIVMVRFDQLDVAHDNSSRLSVCGLSLGVRAPRKLVLLLPALSAQRFLIYCH